MASIKTDIPASYEDLKIRNQTLFSIGPPTALEKYTIINEIGNGAYGTVFLGVINQQVNPANHNQTISNKISDLTDINNLQNSGGHNHQNSLHISGIEKTLSGYKIKHGSKFVAIKRLRVPESDEGMPLSHVREIALLRQLEHCKHENIIRLIDVCTGKSTSCKELRLNLVFEHVDYDLDKLIKKQRDTVKEHLPIGRIKNITQQMLRGIDFLHQHRIFHRDLKPQNVLLSKNDQVKIADFGLARVFSFDMALTSVVVTLWYRPPEVLLQSSYATPVDLWSLGCILVELINLKPLFPGSCEIDQLDRIFKVLGTPKVEQEAEEWPKDAAVGLADFKPRIGQDLAKIITRVADDEVAMNFIRNILTFNPDKRLTARSALQHAWFLS